MGERMPECVTADVLDQTGRAHSFLSGPLQDRFVGMMAAFLASSSVLPRVLLRKDPLPTPVGGCRHRSKPYRGTRLGKSLRYPSRCLPNGRGRDLDQKRHQGIERPFADVGNGSTAEILHLVERVRSAPASRRSASSFSRSLSANSRRAPKWVLFAAVPGE